MGLFTLLSYVLMIMLPTFNAFFAFRTYPVVCLHHGLVMGRSDQCQVFMHAGYQDRHNGLGDLDRNICSIVRGVNVVHCGAIVIPHFQIEI